MGGGDDVLDGKVSAAIDGGGVLDAGQVHGAKGAMADAAAQVEERIELWNCFQKACDAILVSCLCWCMRIEFFLSIYLYIFFFFVTRI